MSGSDVQRAAERPEPGGLPDRTGRRLRRRHRPGRQELSAPLPPRRHRRRRPRRVVHQLQAVDALDAQTTDASPGSGGIAITTAGHTKLKVTVRTKSASKTKKTASATADPHQRHRPGDLRRSSRTAVPSISASASCARACTGHDVRVLQSYLTIAGYPTTVDGDFGPTTKASVTSVRAGHNLPANGVVTYPRLGWSAPDGGQGDDEHRSPPALRPRRRRSTPTEPSPRPPARRSWSRRSSPPPTRSSTSHTSTAAVTELRRQRL